MLYMCARTMCVPHTSTQHIVQRFDIHLVYVHGFQILLSQLT